MCGCPDLPADGYEFVGWEFDDGDVYDILDGGKLTDATLKIKPGSDIHAHAIFKPKATQPATVAPASEPATSAPATTPSTTPKTGDTTHMLLWLIISGLAFIGLVALVVVYIRLRKKES